MGYQGTRLLTNGEHDSLWRDAFTAIPQLQKNLSEVHDSLRRSNIIQALKALYEAKEITKTTYQASLLEILRLEQWDVNAMLLADIGKRQDKGSES